MRIVALDCSLTPGWAFGPNPMAWGVERIPADASNGARLIAFYRLVDGLVEKFRADTLAVESPLPRKSIAQSRLAFGWLACCQMIATLRKLRFLEAYPGTVKKHLTGKGNADKAEMIAECRRRGWAVDNDNAADALGVLHWSLMQMPARARAA